MSLSLDDARRSGALPRGASALTLLAIAACAFSLGRWSRRPPAAAACPEAVAIAAPAATTACLPPAIADPAPAPSTAPAALAPRTRSRGATPRPSTPAAPVTVEAMARASAEARAKVERLHGYITSSCWRAEPGEGPVKVTWSLAFDASGQEVARVVSEEHGGRAGAFGSCLRKLPGTALSIAPPGATVAVTVAARSP
jgi:hypothetical protein